jgi:disulfide bond formation protein DsbB
VKFEEKNAPNKACIRRVGVCAIYKHFSGFRFFLLPNIVHARQKSANANRWAAIAKFLVKKETIMIDALSTLHNRTRTIIILVICGLLAIAAAVVGIDDNPPGILLAYLAATAFVLAFVHPWRSARKFMFLLLASVLGFVLFVILNIISDSVAQNPATSSALRDLMQSPAMDALGFVIAILCPVAFIVGAVGSVAMFIRNRRRPT